MLCRRSCPKLAIKTCILCSGGGGTHRQQQPLVCGQTDPTASPTMSASEASEPVPADPLRVLRYVCSALEKPPGVFSTQSSAHHLHCLHLRRFLHGVWQPTLSFGSSSSFCARRRCHSRRRSSTTRPSYAASPVTASGSSTRSVPRRSSCTAASPAGARATRTPSRSSAHESSCASTSLQCWSHRRSMIGCTRTCSMTRNGCGCR